MARTLTPPFEIIPPNPGEYVDSLLERGLNDDAIETQRKQYMEGFLAALCRTRVILDVEPAARVTGYQAGLDWLSTGNRPDWLDEIKPIHIEYSELFAAGAESVPPAQRDGPPVNLQDKIARDIDNYWSRPHSI